jgi:hypothetical protein
VWIFPCLSKWKIFTTWTSTRTWTWIRTHWHLHKHEHTVDYFHVRPWSYTCLYPCSPSCVNFAMAISTDNFHRLVSALARFRYLAYIVIFPGDVRICVTAIAILYLWRQPKFCWYSSDKCYGCNNICCKNINNCQSSSNICSDNENIG